MTSWTVVVTSESVLQAESVGEFIDDRTVGAADSALAGLKGGISDTICDLRSTCLDILSRGRG